VQTKTVELEILFPDAVIYWFSLMIYCQGLFLLCSYSCSADTCEGMGMKVM